MSGSNGGRGGRLCLFHQGVVKPVGGRRTLLPFACDKCLATTLRGDAPPEQVEEVLRSSELWADEEARLP